MPEPQAAYKHALLKFDLLRKTKPTDLSKLGRALEEFENYAFVLQLWMSACSIFAESTIDHVND